MTIPRLYADDPPSSKRGPDRSPESLAEARSRVGQTLASKYRLDDVVGSGGMGHVYKATNTDIGRTVAIKVLRPELAQYPEIVERFLREARTANRVNHPNVVDVTDVGKDEEGRPFIVQEFLEGETLLDFATRQGGKLTLSELADIIGPVLSAVAEAHQAGIVHRDLKPENVFLAGRRGRRIPKVLDFGISKAREAESELTKVGVMMGTPAYMPPEVVVSFRDADARSDVWALGVIVFEMLAGRLPFDGATIGEVFKAVATQDALRLSDYADVPEALADVVARCMKRDPAERYPDAKALAVDLARAIEEKEPDAARQWSLRPPSAGGGAVPTTKPELAAGDAEAMTPKVEVGGKTTGRGATVVIPKDAKVPADDRAALIAKLERVSASGAVQSLASTLPSESSKPKAPEPKAAEPKAPEKKAPAKNAARDEVESKEGRTEATRTSKVKRAEGARPRTKPKSPTRRVALTDIVLFVAVIAIVAAVALIVAANVR